MHLCFCWRVKSSLLTLFLSKLGSPARWRGWHFDCRLLSDDRPSQLIRCGGQESWDRWGSLSSRSQYLCSLRSTSKRPGTASKTTSASSPASTRCKEFCWNAAPSSRSRCPVLTKSIVLAEKENGKHRDHDADKIPLKIFEIVDLKPAW